LPLLANTAVLLLALFAPELSWKGVALATALVAFLHLCLFAFFSLGRNKLLRGGSLTDILGLPLLALVPWGLLAVGPSLGLFGGEPGVAFVPLLVAEGILAGLAGVTWLVNGLLPDVLSAAHLREHFRGPCPPG
jgi:hypothetical protein